MIADRLIRCATHHRFLSWAEGKAGACFWCLPWLDTRSAAERKVRAVSHDEDEPSGFDDADAQEALFWV